MSYWIATTGSTLRANRRRSWLIASQGIVTSEAYVISETVRRE